MCAPHQSASNRPNLPLSPRPAKEPVPASPQPRPPHTPKPATTEFARQIAASLAEKQGEDIAILDVHGALAIVDYFVVATVRNTRQAQAIAKEVDLEVKHSRGKRKHNQGGMETEESNWVLLDFDEVVVHLFLPEARTYYALENLFADAPRIEAPKTVERPAEVAPIQRPARRSLRLAPPTDEAK